MNCHEARRHFMLYFDSEGDAELHLRINDHLAMCPECAAWFAKQARLQAMVEEKLRAVAATAKVWERVLSRAGLVKPARSRRWLRVGGVVAAAALLLLAGVMVWLSTRPDLARLTAQWHEDLSKGRVAPDYASTSDLDVEKYLHQRVTFKVRCPPRKDVGFAVEGAGVCTLADNPTAYLTGHVEDTPVSIFILKADHLVSFPHQWRAVRRDGTHRCQEGAYHMVLRIIDQNAVLVVGQTESQRLEKVLNAYATYPEHEG